METRTAPIGLAASALFSNDKIYRYELLWRWSPAPLQVGWLLNPSTADQNSLDNTLKKFRNRALQAGLGGIQIINLFALRQTYPDQMMKHAVPVGPGK